MKTLRTLLLLSLVSPAFTACAYFDTAGSEDVQMSSGGQRIYVNEPAYQDQSVRDVIYSSTGGAVSVFDVDGQGGAPKPVDGPIVSSSSAMGLSDGDASVHAVEAAPIHYPSGAITHTMQRVHTGDPSVEVYSLDDDHSNGGFYGGSVLDTVTGHQRSMPPSAADVINKERAAGNFK